MASFCNADNGDLGCATVWILGEGTYVTHCPHSHRTELLLIRLPVVEVFVSDVITGYTRLSR
eukprot:gene14136-8722_t